MQVKSQEAKPEAVRILRQDKVCDTTPPPDHADWKQSQLMGAKAIGKLMQKRRKSA